MSRRQVDSCGELRIFLSDVCLVRTRVSGCARFTVPFYCCNFIARSELLLPWLSWWPSCWRAKANGASVSSRGGGDTAVMSLIFSFTANPRAQDDESHPSPGLCESSDNRPEGWVGGFGQVSVIHKAHSGRLNPPNQFAPFSCVMCFSASEPITTVHGSPKALSSGSNSRCPQLRPCCSCCWRSNTQAEVVGW